MKIKPTILLFLLTLVSGLSLCAGSVRGQTHIPRFREYPVSESFTGKTAPIVITQKDKMFRTRLREARNEKPNFAGHYIVTFWGCGTSCVMGAVIDAKTGKVYWWDFTVCCWPMDVDDKFQPIEFRLNSSLIIFSGARNEKEGDEGTHFYKFENGHFVFIRSSQTKVQSTTE